MLWTHERFVCGVEHALRAEAEGEVVVVDVVALQPHLYAFFGDEAEVFDQFLFGVGRHPAVYDELRQVVQRITHAADYIERIIVFIGSQAVGDCVASEFARFYFFSHND